APPGQSSAARGSAPPPRFAGRYTVVGCAGASQRWSVGRLRIRRRHDYSAAGAKAVNPPTSNSQRESAATLARTERSAIPRRRWRIASLLGIGVLINYFDRVNLSVSHDALFAAFGISNVVFGYLSSADNLTYAALQLPIGVILDKLGVKRVGRIGTFLWSCASFGGAVTPTLGGLFGARFLLGIGEAPTFPG